MTQASDLLNPDAPRVPEAPLAGAPVQNGRGVAGRLLYGTGFYALTNLGIRAFAFLLLALYSRFLSPADFGIVALADAFALVVVTLGGLGLDGALRRLYFQHVDDPAALSRYVSTVLRFAGLSFALTLGAAFLAAPFLLRLLSRSSSVPFFPYVALSLGAAAGSQLVEFRLGLWQAQGRPRAYAGFAFFVFLITTAAVIGFVVVARWGATGLLLGRCLGAGGAAFVALTLSRKWLAGSFHSAYLRETLYLALPLVPHQFIALGLVAADRFILQHYRDLTEVGLYSVAYTLGMVMYLVTASVSLAWSPLFYALARQGESGRQMIGRVSNGIIAALVAIACFGAFVAQDFVLWFLNPRYAAAGRLVPWIIGGYLMHAFFSLLQLSVLQAKKTVLLATLTGLALATNIVLNLWWVPRWGMYGAAYATLAAYALEAGLMYVYAQRVFFLPYQLTRIAGVLAVFGAGLSMSQIAWQGTIRSLVMLSALATAWWILWRIGGGSEGKALLVAALRWARAET